VSKIRRGESVNHFETIRRRKDGSLLPISLTVSPVRDETGRVVGASKIARDVTQRKEAEARIAGAEAAQADLQRRLLTLVDASATLIGTPRPEAVLEGTMTLARALVPADAYAVWRADPTGRAWRAVASAGLSDTFKSAVLEDFQGSPTTVGVF